MLILFFCSLKKRDNELIARFSGIDLSMSVALKGIACVLILMGHFVNRRWNVIEPSLFSQAIYYTTANVALVLFMYFSGYGLILKGINNSSISAAWLKRLKKVYGPLLFVSIVSLIVYSILPVRFSTEESQLLTVPQDIEYLHNFSSNHLRPLIAHALGWKDWYVFCIIIFYSFFYLSKFITRDQIEGLTLVLWIMLGVYFVLAFIFFGKEEAHWYRFCWSFFLGHVHAKMAQSEKVNKSDIVLLIVLMTTILFEGWTMILSYCVAVIIIVLCSVLNKKYLINNKALAFMGGISYFFYLSHERLGYVFVAYFGIWSVLLWVLITIMISFCLSKLYTLVSSVFRR